MTSQLTLLEDLFPKRVVCVISNRPPDDFKLLPAERLSTDKMTALRLREFMHGRACARRALTDLGYPDCPVPTGAERAPAWPTNVVGSISHCGDTAAAAVALSENFGGIGLDIETNDNLNEDLLPLICRSDDLSDLDTTKPRLLLAKLIFSAKESVFKCIWPQVRRFVDFGEVSIQLNLEHNTFTATPHAADLSQDLFASLKGRFRLESMIVTAVTAASASR